MIRIENLSKYYKNSSVATKGLENINLTLNKGEIVAITGESGSGKSTLLNVITKIDDFDEGEIYYKGNETSYFNINDMEQFRKNKIGFIFQNYNIIDSYTVLENVMLPMLINGTPKKEAKEEALKLIEKVGLKDRGHHRGVELSGGEKQRCVIARALASNSEILACDEPTGNLDSETSIEIIKLIKEVSKDKLVLIVSHNFDEIKDIVTRKIKLHDGRIIEDFYLTDFKGEEENVELDLDYVPMARKTDAKIAWSNLKSTPRKTIFSLFVFFIISFIAILLFQFIVTSTESSELDYHGFTYLGNNKLIVYDKDNKEIPLETIKEISNEYTVNAFYEKTSYWFEYSAKSTYDPYAVNNEIVATYEAYPHRLSVDYGRLPENEDEIVLITANRYYSTLENQYIFTDKNVYKVVGVSISTDINRYTGDTCIITGSKKFEKDFRKIFFANHINVNINSRALTVMFDDSLTTRIIRRKNATNVFETYSLYYSGYELINYNKIPKVENDGTNAEYSVDADYLILGYDFFDLVDEHVYEASVYGDKYVLNKKINNLGLRALDPTDTSDVNQIYRFAYNLLTYVIIFFATGSMVLIYFITYLIIARIYASKKASYAIFRTLGVTKKDMNKVVRYEIMTQVIFSSIFIYFLFFILGKTVDNTFFNIFRHIDLFVTIWYFLVILVLGLLLAKRFNRKLFSFTVKSTLKAGE